MSQDEKAKKLNEMREAADKFSSQKTWYEKAWKFIADLEARIAEIFADDFETAVMYFFHNLLPQVMPVKLS